MSSNFLQFDTIEGVEQVRVLVNAVVESGKLILVAVEPKSILKTAKGLRLEISEDGIQWRKFADDVKSSELRLISPTVVGEYALRLATHCAPADPTQAASRLRVQQQVFRHRQRRHQGGFLIDAGDAIAPFLPFGHPRRILAAEADGAPVWGKHPRQHAD